MPTIEQQLNELVKQKNALATALRDKGVEAEDNETLNSLVEKVEGLEAGGPIVPVDNYSELTDTFDLRKVIKHVDIPEGCTVIKGITNKGNSIYTASFGNCVNLESVTVPVSVTKIESLAFGNCSNLKYIYYRGTEAQWNNVKLETVYGVWYGTAIPEIIYNYTG